jgi:hypothetical protein
MLLSRSKKEKSLKQIKCKIQQIFSATKLIPGFLVSWANPQMIDWYPVRQSSDD